MPPVRAVDLEHQVVDVRRDRLAGQSPRCAGSGSARSACRRGSSRCGRAAGRCRRPTGSLLDATRVDERRRTRARAYAGSLNRCTPSRASRSPIRVPPPRPAEDRLALVGVPRAGGPVGVDHQVGHRRGRQDRVVAAGRQVDRRVGPAEPLRPARRPCRAASTSVKSRVAPPTQALLVRSRSLAGAAAVAGRLDVAQPQPGGRAEVGRGDARGRRTRRGPGRRRRPARTPRRAPGRSRSKTWIVGRPGASSQSADGLAGDQVGGVLGRRAAAGGGVGGLAPAR